MWIALLGADRINLTGERGAFVLTPFLVLTPLVCVAELIRRRRSATVIMIPQPTMIFALLALTLLTLSVGSVFASRDLNSSGPRVVQLALMLGGAFSVILLASDRADLALLLARGARWGLLGFALFDVAQLLSWLDVLPKRIPEVGTILQLAPDMYAGVVPRLAGMVMDSNRGGLLLVLFGFLAARDQTDSPRAWRWLSLTAMLLLLTLSRSSMLAAAGAITVLLLSNGRPRLPRRFVAVCAAIVAVAVSLALLDSRLRSDAVAFVEPLQQRFTLLEGSSQDHLRLLERGVNTATQSVETVTHGIGYGSSHLALQDFFPGDRYGNFHSIYVGIFAEAGIFALLTLVLLIGAPITRPGPFQPLAAAVALFGVFYGALSEPAFWVALTLAWLLSPPTNSRPNASTNATAMPSTAPRSS